MKKRLIILVSLLIIYFGGFSQSTIIVSGYIHDLTNSFPIPSHLVNIYSDDSLNPGFNYDIWIYTDTNGIYYDTVNCQLSQGVLLVRTYDCNQVIHDTLISFDSQNTYLNIDFLICDDTSSACQASFLYNTTNNLSVQFYDNSSPNITSWYWDFGDGFLDTIQNPIHTFLQSGTHTVCLSVIQDSLDSIICYDSICNTVVVGNVHKYNLGGQVFDASNTPITDGYAYLYSVYNNHFALADSMHFNTYGYYYFYYLTEGNYIVKILPDQNNSAISQYVPTYYGNDIFWNEATVINLNDSIYDKDVYMITSALSSGPGTINGNLYFNSNVKPNTEILLLYLNGNVVSYTYTDINGAFQFDALAYGTYILNADEAGKNTIPDTITIDANSLICNSQLFMFENVLDVISYKKDCATVTIGNIFPNPVMREMNIEIDLASSTDLMFEIYNILGKKVDENKFSLDSGKHLIKISSEQLSKGIYFLHISSSNGKYSEARKFIK